MATCRKEPSIQSRNSIDDVWGPRTPYLEDWPVRLDMAADEEPQKWVQSACVLCRYVFSKQNYFSNESNSRTDRWTATDAAWTLA